MMIQKPKQPEEKIYLQGTVERVTYHNEENGFCVLRVKVRGHRELVTVVGSLPTVTGGEFIEASGNWRNDLQYGLQLAAESLKTMPPTSLDGIRKYLSSGLIKGIGAVYGERLVAAFGKEVFDIIEAQPEKLLQVDGIGQIRCQKITRGWEQQKKIKEIMLFLYNNGVGTSKAVRIYKTYGDAAISLLQENPYRLARDIYGIGFLTADKIAQKMGIEKNSPLRAKAGLRHMLFEETNNGNCACPEADSIRKTAEILEIDEACILEAAQEEIAAQELIRDSIGEVPCLFLPALYFYEKAIAEKIRDLQQVALPWSIPSLETALFQAEKDLHITLAKNQKEAVLQAVQTKFMVITGGPGVGKTTIVKSILHLLAAANVEILLAAPTGRAAKRLAESTGMEAKTIHRLLEYNPAEHCFTYDTMHPLPCQLLIVDESSMIDAALMHSLLQAVPETAAVLFVGDINQLPSVGPGQILADMIQSEKIKVVTLTEIFRQAKNSRIITNAHAIEEGRLPDISNDLSGDFFFVSAEAPEDASRKIIEIVQHRIPRRWKYDPIRDVQVLCPANTGGIGVRSLNIELQKVLNPHGQGRIEKFGTPFSVGDKVMQIENNYEKEVFNGDLGFIAEIRTEESELIIDFDGKNILYTFDELDEIVLAYACTIHKSQGSEYPVVVIPVMMQHFSMLQRNLIYTGITRGRNLVILVGQKKALAIAVRASTHNKKRLSKLKEWLVCI